MLLSLETLPDDKLDSELVLDIVVDELLLLDNVELLLVEELLVLDSLDDDEALELLLELE